MPKYPGAEWVPWAYSDDDPSYYRGQNQPVAAVLHIAQGWASTIRTWAAQGYSAASWHFTVCRDGTVMQHIELEDGGYQAGIARVRPGGAINPDPTWDLWRGWGGGNINSYTVGIEHEGLTGTPFTPQQTAASISLCKWLASTLGFPYDRAHFPAHADIALIDRAQDFNSPALREAHYETMFAAPPKPPRPSIPVPDGKPIYASADQMRVIQDAVFRRAVLVPDRFLATYTDLPVEASITHPARSVLPKGTTVARYYLYVEVDDDPIIEGE